MNSLRRAGLGLTLAVVGTAIPAQAARPHVRHYTTRDGLPQSQVSALKQDSQGFLWVGTLTGGVARYDGDRFEVYDATSGLPGGSVYCLSLADDGSVYAGTGGGVARFRDGSWWSLPSPDNPNQRFVTSVLPVGDRVFVGTGGGVLVWDGHGRPYDPFPADDMLAHAEITTLTRDHAGGFWVGTSKGAGRVAHAAAAPLGSLRVEPLVGVPDGRVLALLSRPSRPLLVSVGNAGVFEVADEGGVRRLGDDRVPGSGVFVLAGESTDPDAVWIGTDDRGAFRYRDGKFEPFGVDQGLPDESVSTILEDREGIVWFGTDGGLTKRSPSAFTTLDHADGLPEGAPIFGMAEGPRGTLWLSAWNAGLVRLDDRGARVFTPSDGLPGGVVNDVASLPDGGIWVATNHGLALARGDRIETPELPEGMPRYAWVLDVAPDGSLLIGASEGVFALREGKLRSFGPPAGPEVTAVLATDSGDVWAAGEGWGAAVFPAVGAPRRFTTGDGLPSEQVSHVFEDSLGRMWFSTDRGALRLDPDGTREVYDRRHGLPDSFVYWTGEAPDGAIWFGTNAGATRLATDGTFKTFNSRDGLAADECNDDGFFVDSRGRVLIATVGLSVFQGDVRPRRPVAPPVAITEFAVRGLLARDGDRLAPEPGPIRFRFVGLSFTDEDRMRFRYRLIGLSAEWTDAPPGQHETVYGGLAPGAYAFEVEALTDDGRRSDQVASRRFEVLPFWWQTGWARGAGALLALLAVVALVRERERRMRRAHERLESLVAARTEQLREANEQLAQLAVTDDLTGVANRRRVLEGLRDAVALAHRQGTPVSVALIDLDHFKRLNDRYGHAAGDRVLETVAGILSRTLRSVDLLGRYGGEEFLAVLPGSDQTGAVEVADRLRQAVASMPSTEGAGWTPGASVGVATLSADLEDPAELIRRADEALYEAKSAGRNRVVAYRAARGA